ncbi:MAG: hypothetical protein A2X46_18385 [Lentisphaerae bacterium GWF2_57_35]|nr:MAG: hypothetical protein A2X46_18385 [Lentisphaerae bacterium GWF2_57_35]
MTISPEELEQRVKKSVTGGRELSTLWGVVQKVREITSNQRSSVKELVRVIGADSILTSKVLRFVNSAAYGFSGRISNIDQAIVILGFQQLRDLCVSLTLIKETGGAGSRTYFDRTLLWKHSLGTAVACKLIQERVPGAASSNLFVAGLLCNIGRLVLDQHFPKEFEQIMKLAKEQGLRLLDAERRVFNVTHADIGCWAAQAWCLDESLAQCIRDHHGPSGNRNAAIVNLAYVLTQVAGIGSPGEETLTLLVPGVLDTLKLDETEMARLLRDLDNEYQTLEPMFKIMTEK